MRRTGMLFVSLLAACALSGCGGSPTESAPGTSIMGEYECLQPGASEPDIVVLAEDGTLTITHPDGVTEPPGVWSVDGNLGWFGPEGEGESFTIVEGKLVFGDTTECTKTT